MKHHNSDEVLVKDAFASGATLPVAYAICICLIMKCVRYNMLMLAQTAWYTSLMHTSSCRICNSPRRCGVRCGHVRGAVSESVSL